MLGDDRDASALEAALLGASPGMASDQVGLCLSGGGFKASLFHLGALWRLNELGLLPRIDRISSVSGGSITAGWLARCWPDLDFAPDTGVSESFRTRFAQPLWTLCRSARLDAPSVIRGLVIPGRSAADCLAEGYAEALFGSIRLADLPASGPGTPDFVFNAASPQTNSLWRLRRTGVRNWRIGELAADRLTLAQAVAASSAFPPIMSPLTVRLKPGDLTPADGATALNPGDRIELMDGGVYDNMGLEPVWKDCHTLLVCNAGDPFPESRSPARDWTSQFRHTVRMMHRQAENNWIRWLMAMDRAGDRDVAYFGLRGSVAAYPERGLVLPEEMTARARAVPVRLWPTPALDAAALVNHGYAQADVSVRAFWPEAKGKPVATVLPDLGETRP